MNFPKDAAGNWRIQVETEAKQVLGVLRFRVVDSATQIQVTDKSAKEIPASNPAPEAKTETENKIEAREATSSEVNTSEPTQAETNPQAVDVPPPN